MQSLYQISYVIKLMITRISPIPFVGKPYVYEKDFGHILREWLFLRQWHLKDDRGAYCST